MKNRGKVLFVWCVIMGVLFGGVRQGSVSRAGNNADKGLATELVVGTTGTGSISEEGEDAWYKFSTGNLDAFYTVTANATTADRSFAVDLLDAEDNLLDRVNFDTTEKGSICYRLQKNSIYYLQVSMADIDLSGYFELRVDAVVDDYGDTMEEARTIALKKEYSGRFESANDLDYMKFLTRGEEAYYGMSITNKDLEDGLEMSLYTRDEEWIDSWNVAMGEKLTVKVKLEKNTPYYLCAVPGASDGIGTYSVKVTSHMDAGDSLEDASRLLVDVVQNGTIYTETDEDYYVFSTNSVTETYLLELQSITKEEDLVITLYDAEQNEIETLYTEDGKKMSQSYKLAKNKTYYLGIQGYSESVAYTLQVKGTYTNPKTVILNKTKLTLKKGKKATLTLRVTPKKAVIQKVQWTSSKKKVASISKKGVVHAKKKGNTIIKCKATFYGGRTKTVRCKVTVKK